ncbi:MAG: aminopeptidase P family protein [Thaumarchaeota archaeon]|nr:aminopeptidase P family protein [Nitrososphaerota archaeon]
MATGAAYSSRLKRLRQSLESSKLDGMVIVPGPNMRYFSGVNSLLLERPFFLLVPVDGGPHLVAPALEAGPYRHSPLKAEIHGWTDSQGWREAVASGVRGVAVAGRWGVEAKVPFLFFSKIQALTRARFEDAEPVLQGLRELKDEGEVELLKSSGRILGKAFEKFPDFMKEGVTESELARLASDEVYSGGATKVDDLLVQSGERAADPHSLPSGKKVRRGESIIFDIGSTFDGYYADVTRTFCIGKSLDVEKVYSKVLEAEEKGIAAASDGTQVGEVDGAARGTLERAGLGRFFIHRTGHGLGLEVHEAPYIVEGGRERLRESMCFTVEPGVYQSGKLGVRIEDDVLIVDGKGVEITRTPKEYGWWA